jgi:2-dehydropantoate 2-reductase
MNVIILGAGAIGSLYGAKLSKLNDVTLVARKEHADMINENGLKITGVEEKTYKLRARTAIDSIEDDALIILTTKVYDSEKTVDSIKNFVKKNNVVLCLQNGYGSEEIVKKIVGKKCLVLRGVTAVGTSFLEPGVIKMNNIGYTAIEKSPKSEEIADNFSECKLKGYVSENIKEDVWRKLILNCVLNPITAILKIKNREIVHESLKPLRRSIIRECIEVAKKDGFDFDFESIEEMIDRIRNSDNYSSTYQDIFKGKRTEIDYLNGAVAKLGKKYGTDCKVNEGLAGMIRFLESQRQR